MGRLIKSRYPDKSLDEAGDSRDDKISGFRMYLGDKAYDTCVWECTVTASGTAGRGSENQA